MTVFADTSALFALLASDDADHASAMSAFPGLREEGEILTHNYVVVEAAALVQRRLGHVAVRALLEDLVPALKVIWIDEDTHRAAVAALLAASRRRVSFVDRVSFEVMRGHGVERAFAFDDDFRSQGFTTLP